MRELHSKLRDANNHANMYIIKHSLKKIILLEYSLPQNCSIESTVVTETECKIKAFQSIQKHKH